MLYTALIVLREQARDLNADDAAHRPKPQARRRDRGRSARSWDKSDNPVVEQRWDRSSGENKKGCRRTSAFRGSDSPACTAPFIPGGSGASDQRDASSLGIAGQPVLARIASIQRPASALPAAVRSPEGDGLGLCDLRGVTARSGRCCSVSERASRLRAGRTVHLKSDPPELGLLLAKAKQTPCVIHDRAGWCQGAR